MAHHAGTHSPLSDYIITAPQMVFSASAKPSWLWAKQLHSLSLVCLMLPFSSAHVVFSEQDQAFEQQFGAYGRKIADDPSSCIPANTVLHSMANAIDWPMVELQTQRIATEACFFSRYMIVTLDDDAHKACQEHPGILHCFRWVQMVRAMCAGSVLFMNIEPQMEPMSYRFKFIS